jgi:DNA repair photolyase
MSEINHKNKDFILNAIKKELKLFEKLFKANLIHLTTYDSNKKRLEKKVSDIEKRFEPVATLPKELWS